MKKITIISAILLLFFSSKAQVTLDYSYSGNEYNSYNFRVMNLGDNGLKYVGYVDSIFTVNIYNLDYTLFKSISIDTSQFYHKALINGRISHVTDHLFDSDNEVEFIYEYYTKDTSGFLWSNGNLVIINEDGLPLFITSGIGNNDYHPFIYNTPVGTKMLIYTENSSDSVKIYSLPGSLPCDSCSGIGTGKKELKMASIGSINSYPNPTNGLINVEYSLPPNVNQGEIVLYNTNGILINKYSVNNSSNILQLDLSTMSSGIYYYQLVTEKGSTAKKIIVAK